MKEHIPHAASGTKGRTVGHDFASLLKRQQSGTLPAGPMQPGGIEELPLTIYQQGWSVLVRGTMHHVDVDTADFRARFDSEP